MSKQTNMTPEMELANLYHRVFSSPDGIKVLQDLVVHFEHNEPSFKGDFNSHKAAQHDGAKLVINHILRTSAPTVDA